MKLIYLLVLSLYFCWIGCRSDTPKTERAAAKVESTNAVEMREDSLVQIKNGQLIFSTGASKVLPFADDTTVTTLILVRHAEKDTVGEDPELTAAGQARAERLATILQDFPLDGVYTNIFTRTVKTAQPTAYQQAQAIQFYEDKTASDFIIQLAARQIGKNILVVGRANTVPQMLNRLLGEARFSDIDNEDYNNIYVVTIGKDGQAVSVVRAVF